MNTKEFNSLSDVLKYFVRMNQNVLDLLTSISKSVTSENEVIVVSNVGPDGIERTFNIPSYYYFSKKINEINNNVEKLYQIKDKELNNPIFSKYLISDDKKIVDINSPIHFSTKPNFFLENLLNPLLFFNLDLTNKIKNETSRVLVKRLLLNLDNENKKEFFNFNFKNVSNLEYSIVLNQLNVESITFIEDEDIRDLTPSMLKYSGYYDILNISTETFKNQKYNYTQQITINSLEYNDNINNIKKQLKIGDILLSDDGDTEFEILNIDFTKNLLLIGRKSGYDELIVGQNKLKIATEPTGVKTVEIPVAFNEYQIIFTKIIDPHFNIIPREWNSGFGFYSNELTIITDEGLKTLEDFYSSYVVDFGKVLNELAKQTNINQTTTETILSSVIKSEISDDNNIIIDSPIISQNSFKIVDINENLIDKTLINKSQDILGEKNNLDNYKKSLENEIDELNKLINDEIRKTSPNIVQIEMWKNEKAEKELNKIDTINQLNLLIDDMKNLSISTEYEPFPMIIGAIQLPTIPNNINIFKTYIEYKYRFLTEQKISPNSFLLELGNNNVTSSYWNHIFGPNIYNIKNTGDTLQKLDNLNPDIYSINEIQIPLYNVTPKYIEIQCRLCYQINPITQLRHTNWSNAILLEYKNYYDSYINSPINYIKNELYKSEILKKHNEMESIIINLNDRIKKLEDIKTTNSYQYKDVIVLSEYNILNKSFELTKTPSSQNIIMQVIGGQPIAPDEYKLYYKRVEWGENSIMNSLTTGDTIIIEYLI